MNKLTWLGIILLGASGTTVIFEAASSMMAVGTIVLEHFTLESTLGYEQLQFIEELPPGIIQDAADYLIQVPIFLGLAVLGVVSLIVGGFTAR